MATVQWSRDDEVELVRMLRRKTEFEAAAQLPVLTVVSGAWPFSQNTRTDVNCKKLAQWLIRHAETLRDVLLPFETGIRVAPAKPIPMSSDAIDRMISAKHFDGNYPLKQSDESCLNWYRLGVRDCEMHHNITYEG